MIRGVINNIRRQRAGRKVKNVYANKPVNRLIVYGEERRNQKIPNIAYVESERLLMYLFPLFKPAVSTRSAFFTRHVDILNLASR